MIAQRTILRVARFLLLAGVALLIWFFWRGKETYTIPEGDRSMAPTYPPGSTVVVRRVDADTPLERGQDLVYAMERDGTEYARFGRLRGLPGDVVGAQDGKMTVNGEPIGPIPVPGPAMGVVPDGHLLILSIDPAPDPYPDSRRLGFVPRSRIRAIIRYALVR